MTTEQALRRLEILGYTMIDEPIEKAVNYMNDCLIGKNKIPDREEKRHNWKIYTELMLSTWIRVFTKKNKNANKIAEKWSEIINNSFINQSYDHSVYKKYYEKIIGIELNPEAGRLVDFVHFYPISLLTNSLDKKNEEHYFKYILEHESGMYYVYNRKITSIPKLFQSKNTSYYLRAIELLSKYDNPECRKQLKFIAKWLNQNKINNDEWGMGKEVKDGIYFPLSDSWRTDANRIKDCTYRINKLLGKI
jgi:hypothetical protein